jgi:hypothetical protein
MAGMETRGVAPTLTASTSRHYERYKVGQSFRRLTNVEYARLQGLVMKTQSNPQKPKTLDEVCGKEAHSFELFLKEKSRILEKMEEEADARIRQSLADKLAWSV